MKIGIPRALLYHWYGGVWQEFWQACGCETVISPETDRDILSSGVEIAIDELCLPMKIFLGHVRYLAENAADMIMIPHPIKIDHRAYLCPKFLGLPDIVRHTLPQYRDRVFAVTIDVDEKADLYTALRSAALKLGIPKKQIPEQLPTAIEPFREKIAGAAVHSEKAKALRLGVLGHPYCLYDACLNMDILNELHKYKVDFVVPEQLPTEFVGRGTSKLSKELFWSLGRLQLDALEWMISSDGAAVDGFIDILPFACGPEAIIGDLLERRIKNAELPLLRLYFEEQSGEAGVITRLEAFIDLLKYRRKLQ